MILRTFAVLVACGTIFSGTTYAMEDEGLQDHSINPQTLERLYREQIETDELVRKSNETLAEHERMLATLEEKLSKLKEMQAKFSVLDDSEEENEMQHLEEMSEQGKNEMDKKPV